MAEVTTRGGGLPRSGLRGRGRGRGGSNFNGTPHSNNSTNGFTSKVNGHRPYQARPSTHSPPNDEPEELKMIRKKHGQKLATIRELFPTWTDEDLLMALNEASGDLELAATRISEGKLDRFIHPPSDFTPHTDLTESLVSLFFIYLTLGFFGYVYSPA